jgi:hypothetical protein
VVVPSTFVGTLGGSAGERSLLQPLLDAMGVRLTCSDATLYRQYHPSLEFNVPGRCLQKAVRKHGCLTGTVTFSICSGRW